MFSGKKKKEQLQAKRERKRQKARGNSPDDAPPSDAEEQLVQYSEGRHGVRSMFKKETDEELEARKRLNYAPLCHRKPMTTGVSFDDWYRVPSLEEASAPFRFFPFSVTLPRRGWLSGNHLTTNLDDANLTEAVLAEEEDRYRAYLRAIDSYHLPQGIQDTFKDAPPLPINVFERNIDVWRQFWRTVDTSDVMVVVADARYPIFHLPLSLVHYIVVEEKKSCVVILSKIDLISKSVLERWLEFLPRYFQSVGIPLYAEGQCGVVIKTFTANPTEDVVGSDRVTSRQAKHKTMGKHYEALRSGKLPAKKSSQVHDSDDDSEELYHSTERFRGMEQANRAVQAEKRDFKELQVISAIITELLDLCRSVGALPGSDRHVRIGLTGYPNVGKSSLLNCIMGSKVVSVSATAGRTKHLQTIPIPESGVVLIDSPGIVFPVFGIPRQLHGIIGTHQIAQTRDPQSCVGCIALHLPLESLYGLKKPDGSIEEEEWNPYDLCEAYATKRGFFVKHGKGALDIHRASISIVQEVFDGRLKLYFAPPELDWLESPCFKQLKSFLRLRCEEEAISG